MEDNKDQPIPFGNDHTNKRRQIHIEFDPETGRIEVSGHIADKFTALQMLAEAGHIVINTPVQASTPNGKAS